MISSAVLIDSFAGVCIKSMHTVMYAIEFLVCGAHPHVTDRIQGLDVQPKMQIVACFLKENEARLRRHEYMTLLIRGIHEIVQDIERDIALIQAECDAYKARYFTYWRTPNVQPLLQLLQDHSACFDRRVEYMLRFATAQGRLSERLDDRVPPTYDTTNTLPPTTPTVDASFSTLNGSETDPS
jgi:hypothetical protein